MGLGDILKYSCLPVLVFIAGNSFAQSEDKVVEMDSVVVATGQYRPQSVKNSVYNIRVISAEQLQKLAASKLQDVLNTQLNIRFSQDLSTGGSNINMLGLSGQNVKILLDGVPMIGRQGTSNEININQIDINSIERIEIIEGPMSVVYGADALAGVINIITKRPKTDRIGVNANVLEETVGKEYGLRQGIHNQYLGVSASYKKWYINGGVGRNLFNGWKDTLTGRELAWHKKDQIVANALVGYRTERLNIYYRLDGLDEIITNPANLPEGAGPALDQDYITDRLMQQIQATYTFNDRLFANALGSYTHFTRQVYSTLFYPNGDVRASTAPGTQSLSTFNGATVRANVVYKVTNAIAFQSGIDINSEEGDGERMKAGKQKIEDYALFVTAEIKPVSRINIKPGVRFIKNSVYEAPPVVPSLDAKVALANNIDLRLAYARGFRAPSLRELYYDFFDASHSIIGNPDLEAEHSNSFTGSLTWKFFDKEHLKFNSVLNGFYNNITNMIGFAASPSNSAVTTYMNIDHYKTRGASLVNELRLNHFNASLGFGYTGRYNQYSEEDHATSEFKWSPEVTAIASYNFQEIGLVANLFYKYTGKLPYYQQVSDGTSERIRLAETSGYHWADLTMNKKLGKLVVLNAGVRNLFGITTISNTAVGEGAHSTTGPQPIGYGRSYFLGLTFNWEKSLSNK